jgi:hypothetical protein
VLFVDSNWDTWTVEITAPIPLIYVWLPIKIQFSNNDTTRQELTTTTWELINWSWYVKFVTSHFTTFNLSAGDGSFTINNDALSVNNTSVTLYNNVPYADQMKFWNTFADVNSAWWSTYASTSAWTISSVWWSGTKTVYAMFRNSKDGSQITVSDIIVYGTTDTNLAIKLYYFGTWSEFTQKRNNRNWCNPATMNVVNVPSRNDNSSNRMPLTLSANTIYILNSWNHLAPGEITLGNCIGIIWSGAWNKQYWNTKIFYYWSTPPTSLVNLYDGNWIIIDNIWLDWYNNWAWSTHAKLNYWLYRNNYNAGTYWSQTQEFSLRNSKIANFTNGIYTYWPYHNKFIKYSEIFNNTYWIYIWSTNDHELTIDESLIYNNTTYWIYLGCTISKATYINNSHIFNNWDGIYQECNTTQDSVLYINNSSIYNNSVWISAIFLRARQHNNSCKIFNNGIWAKVDMQWWIFFYWTNYLYQNTTNTQIWGWWWSISTWSSIGMPMLRSDGIINTGQKLFSRNDVINPINKNNNTYLLNRATGNYTTLRWKISSRVDFIPNTNISRNGWANWWIWNWILQTIPVWPWWTRWGPYWSTWLDRNPSFPIGTQQQPIGGSLKLIGNNSVVFKSNIATNYILTGTIKKQFTGTIEANKYITQEIQFANTWIWQQSITVIFQTWGNIAHYSDETYFCTTWRSNDNYLNDTFRDTNPTNTQILCAVFGSWWNNTTPYTQNRTWWWNTCWTPTISTINPGTDTLPATLNANTIYIMASWTYIAWAANQRTFNGNCTAILGKWTVRLYSTNNISSTYWLLYASNKSYNIVDNVFIDGYNNGAGSTHTRNSKWVYIVGWWYHVLNNIQTTQNQDNGIMISNSNNNQFLNIKSYYNWNEQILLYWWQNNIFNNIETYNSTDSRFFGWTTTTNWIGLTANTTISWNIFNNIISYNNPNHWIDLNDQWLISNNAFTNIITFNNNYDWVSMW